MKCDECKKNEATYHSRTNVNGRVSEVHLCQNCLEKSNYNPFSVFTHSLFDTSDYIFPDFMSKRLDNSAVCKKCGTTLSQILNLGKIGCSECYHEFKDNIMYAISSLNYGDKHIGKKIEDKSLQKTDTQKKIDALTKKLKKLVSEEKYEEAAIIKKEIDSLKAGDVNEK